MQKLFNKSALFVLFAQLIYPLVIWICSHIPFKGDTSFESVYNSQLHSRSQDTFAHKQSDNSNTLVSLKRAHSRHIDSIICADSQVNSTTSIVDFHNEERGFVEFICSYYRPYSLSELNNSKLEKRNRTFCSIEVPSIQNLFFFIYRLKNLNLQCDGLTK